MAHIRTHIEKVRVFKPNDLSQSILYMYQMKIKERDSSPVVIMFSQIDILSLLEHDWERSETKYSPDGLDDVFVIVKTRTVNYTNPGRGGTHSQKGWLYITDFAKVDPTDAHVGPNAFGMDTLEFSVESTVRDGNNYRHKINLINDFDPRLQGNAVVVTMYSDEALIVRETYARKVYSKDFNDMDALWIEKE